MIPLSVFIVHPDAETAARLARAVAAAGHAPVALSDGERAIDRFVQEPADVVVLEYMLPGRDGIATMEAIRYAPGGRHVRMVMLASVEPDGVPVEELATRIGALATLFGPADEREIVRILGGLGQNGAMGQPEWGMSAERGDARNDRATVTSFRAATPLGPPDLRALASPPTGPVSADFAVETVLARVPESALQLAQRIRSRARREDGAGVHDTAEHDAEPALPSTPSWEGRFEDISFAQLLAELEGSHATGLLVCADGRDGEAVWEGQVPTRELFVACGAPLSIRSNLVRDCLGQLLLRAERIDEDALALSLTRMKQENRLQGEILVDMEALSLSQISLALADQARQKLFDLFAWRVGSYQFFPAYAGPPDAARIDMCLPEILYDGICTSVAGAQLREQLLPELDRYVVLHAAPLGRFSRVRIAPELRHVLSRIDGSMRLREVLATGTRPGAIAQLMYAMRCVGAASFHDQRSGTRRTWSSFEPTGAEAAEATVHSGRTREESRVEVVREAEARREPTPPGALDARVDRLFAAERHARRGHTALERGRLDEAIDAFQRASTLCPEQAEFVAFLGWSRFCAADQAGSSPHEALETMLRARQIEPQRAITHLLHARSLERLARPADALLAYRNALEADTECDEALRAITRLTE